MKSMEKFKNFSPAEQTQVILESWKKLNEKQRSHYEQLAQEDTARFKKETRQFEKKGYFKDKDGRDSRDSNKPKKPAKKDGKKDVSKKAAKVVKSKVKRDSDRKSSKSSKSEKDSAVKPKRTTSAFLAFSNQSRPQVAKENPDKKMTELAKIIAEKWNKLTENDKKPFIKM